MDCCQKEIPSFKIGETAILFLTYEINDDVGITSYDNLHIKASIREQHSIKEIPVSAISLNEDFLKIEIPKETSKKLKTGFYILEVQFERITDGFVQKTPDFKIKFSQETIK